MPKEKREINMIYWRNFFVPIVISLLFIVTIVIFVNINVGIPNPILAAKKIGGLRHL
jgi:hypothetical protein